MADAPAGGGGWGVLEIILAVVLAIGLIATLTGTPIPTLTGSSKSSNTSSTKNSDSSTSHCGLLIDRPVTKEKISSVVTISGSIEPCLNTVVVPDVLTAYVIDSKGTVLSDYTSIQVNKSFLGDADFSTTIPLQGAAQSTVAYVVIHGGQLDRRIQISLLPGSVQSVSSYSSTSTSSSTQTTTSSNGSYFVPTTTSNQTSTSSNNTF